MTRLPVVCQEHARRRLLGEEGGRIGPLSTVEPRLEGEAP
jgi:hypothetical protein